MAKWGTILGAFDISTFLGQVLANLVAEFTEAVEKGDDGECNALERDVMTIVVAPQPYWELYVDEASNQRSLRIGIVMISLECITI